MAPAGAEGIALVVEAMREAGRLHAAASSASYYRGGASRRLLADGRVLAAAASARSGLRGAALEPAGAPSTTRT